MINLDDPKQRILNDSGWVYHRGGIWSHPQIKYEDGSGIKEWTLHEAYMWEMYNVWVSK